jgi:glycosyltransferase involved in cell wall biosynthesis
MVRAGRLTMRIAFITPEFVTETYFSGGLANYVHRVSKALVSLGHDVHVVTLSDGRVESFEHDKVVVHPVVMKKSRRWLNRVTRHRLNDTWRWLDFSFQAFRKLKILHKKDPFNVLQFANSRGCGLWTELFTRVPSATRISCYRPEWNAAAGIPRNFDAKATEWLEWLQLRLSRNIYAPSHALCEMLDREGGIKSVRLIRTPFYFETEQWDDSIYQARLKGRKYLLFVGRFQLHKGFHILAQALPAILDAHRECHAAFVGLDLPSPLGSSMREYALQLCAPHAERLVFVDQTPHAKLYPVISNARLVVLPSLVDNLPNTMLESMALGRPVVGTIGASFDEVIEDGRNGFLVPKNDAHALAEKVIGAWKNPRLQEIGQAARETMLDFAPHRTVQDLLTYFADLSRDKK